jgi:hypothetical protein
MGVRVISRRRTRNKHPLGDPRFGETHLYRWQVGTRWVEHGDPVKVRGWRGQFRFIRVVESEVNEPIVWLWDAGGAHRFVRPNRVKLAPRSRKSMPRRAAA